MREKLQEFQGDAYERPNQPWMCALDDEQGACPIGPTRLGRCPQAAACHPVLEGQRWQCNRSPGRGGPCEEGPSPEGHCSHVYKCQPLMSLRLQRKRFVWGCLLFTLGALIVMLSADWRNEFLAPGPLTSHHAQLLAKGHPTDRCATCHAAGNQSVQQWLGHAIDPELAQPTQSELCMECHRKQIQPGTELWAHNVDPDVLLPSAKLSTAAIAARRDVDPTEPLACSTCHREHHGAEHNLSWMSDSACQTCHAQQYQSFATDHPAFTSWPSDRRTRIVFDHSSHQANHFVESKEEFDCAMCHTTDATGSFQRTLAYEDSCAKCHDEDLENSWVAGVPVFSLPMLEIEALVESGHEVGQWPAEAADEFDGALPSITKFLIASDPRAAEDLKKLGADFDFFDLDPEDEDQLAAAAEIVWAAKELYYDLATEGQQAIDARLEKLLGRELTSGEHSRLTARLSPENVGALTSQWLTRLPEEIAARREKEEGQSLPTTGASPASQDREAARQKVAAGGWFRDDLTLAVRYQPTGHADPFLTSWMEVLAEAASGTHAEIAEPLLRQEMLPTAAGQCGSCHSLDRVDGGRWQINWLAKQPGDRGRSFTVFSHGPHLSQASLADCRSCHAISATAITKSNYQGNSPHDAVDGFEPVTRASCAECHTQQAAGDSCLTCHRYHTSGGN